MKLVWLTSFFKTMLLGKTYKQIHVCAYLKKKVIISKLVHSMPDTCNAIVQFYLITPKRNQLVYEHDIEKNISR